MVRIPAGALLVLVASEPDRRKTLFAALAKRDWVQHLEVGTALARQRPRAASSAAAPAG